MEKQLRSSFVSSPEEFLSTASKFALKSSRTALKTLIHGVEASSGLCSSLPRALERSISLSLRSFREPNPYPSAPRLPTERKRESSRRSKIPEPDLDEADESKKRISQSLQVFAHIIRLCVAHPENAFAAEDLLPGAQSLHENLIDFDSESGLSSEVASLCEDWWKECLAGREKLISQSLPLLLARSLTSTKKQELHRVYSLREALTLFDFEDDSIEDLKLLLLRCVVAPLFMKAEEGRRFVAFTFGLNHQLLKELLAMIRSQIPLAGKSMLEAYGDLLYRAWKVSEESFREEIENRFLQGLIEAIIQARTESLCASIRRVLGVFVNQRTMNGVEKLLFRLSEPLIFRSLQVANSNVRKNALHLLLDLFPLEDPDSTKEVKDTLLGTQFYLLEKLLVDDCPDIRVVAVEGCCRVLNLFWEIIPSPNIPKILTKIIDDMSHDVSNEVRLSTLNGIIYLLGNPQSHEILKVLLPRLKHLVLDNSLSIRRAALDLLLAIRDIQNFQFNKVVGLDVLLDVLANDQDDVAQKITRLLMPSYFPSKASVEEACNRCFALIKRSPLAGARFCDLAEVEGVAHDSLVELAKGLVGLVLSVDGLSSDRVEGLLLAASNICTKLTNEPKYKNALEGFFVGESLKRLFERASDSGRAQSSLFKIASTMAIDEGYELLDGCMSSVTNCIGLSGDDERQAKVRSAHQLLVSCGMIDCMVEVLMSLLQKTAYHCHLKYGTEVPKLTVSSGKRKRNSSPCSKILAKWKHVGGKKPIDFVEDYSVSLGISWQIKDLLRLEDTRKALLESQNLESVFLALRIISEISILQCTDCEYMDVAPVSAYTALSLHMTLENISVRTKDSVNKQNDNSELSESTRKIVLEQTLVHILDCTNHLFGALNSEKSESKKSTSKRKQTKTTHERRRKESEADPSGQDDSDQKGFPNKMKMLTAILQFLTDSTTMGFVFNNHERSLKFTSDYLRHVGSFLRHRHSNENYFEENGAKDSFLCLKSSLTYASKLLALALKDTTSEDSSPSELIFVVANDILDVITSVELYLGSVYAAQIVGPTKPWLPDLVLALGSHQVLKRVELESGRRTPFDVMALCFPSWLSAVAKIELSEMAKIDHDDEDEEASGSEEVCPVLKKLVEEILVLVRRNCVLIDALGEIFLIALQVGLERKDFVLVLGIAHFVCVKLFGHDEREWGEAMMSCLKVIYPKIERLVEQETGDDERQKLESCRALLQPVWMHHLYQTGNLFAEPDE